MAGERFLYSQFSRRFLLPMHRRFEDERSCERRLVALRPSGRSIESKLSWRLSEVRSLAGRILPDDEYVFEPHDFYRSACRRVGSSVDDQRHRLAQSNGGSLFDHAGDAGPFLQFGPRDFSHWIESAREYARISVVD